MQLPINKFGTDGIRGIVNKGLTPRVAYDLGCSLALFLLEQEQKPTVLIAKDTRTSCDMLISGLCLGLNVYGVNSVIAGEMPTPALAFITKEMNYSAGVMITASHNSYEYNGFKIFDRYGIKFDVLSTLTLERFMQVFGKFDYAQPSKMGQNKVKGNLISVYTNYIKKHIVQNDKKIVFDCANGVTYNVVKKLFPHAIFTGKELHKNKENLQCGATCVDNLVYCVKEHNGDIGFSFDGDGDRIITVLSNGKVLDGDDELYILAKYMLTNGLLNKKEVVGTVMTNYGIERALNDLGIKLLRQSVGDKYVCAEMNKKQLLLGAEQSGHLIISRDCLIGDGIYGATQILKIFQEVGDLFNYTKEVKKYKQINTSVQVAEEMKDYVLDNFEFKTLLDACENELACNGRVFVRKSGTENLIRILVEGLDIEIMQKIEQAIRQKIIEIAK